VVKAAPWKMANQVHAKNLEVATISVGDPDPVGSGPFCRIRSDPDLFAGSGSGNFDRIPLKLLIINQKRKFFYSNIIST
jgi:hypothetical protein